MELYLVQHGEATKEEENPERPLTEKGKADVVRVADFLQRLDLKISLIKHSGKLRARQTAEEWQKRIKAPGGLQQVVGLAPNEDVRPIWKEVTAAKDNMMIVGHLPHLSKLASTLLGKEEHHKVINFQMGGVVRLDRDEATQQWSVGLMISPQLLSP